MRTEMPFDAPPEASLIHRRRFAIDRSDNHLRHVIAQKLSGSAAER